MLQWALWLILIISILMTAIPQGLSMQISELEESIKKGNSEYCWYAVLDVETGEMLLFGEKFKRFQNMQHDRRFFKFPFNIVYEYSKYKIVNGRTCLVLYWANAPILQSRKNLVRCKNLVRGVTATGENIRIR